MSILSCASYYGSGSSAITDILSEFDSCVALGDYEFRFVQDPDGISDLEYNLVENYHRHNSGHALKKYKRLVDFLSGGKFVKKYEAFFKGNFKKLSYEYIDALTDYSFVGYWHEDVRNKGKYFYMRKRFVNKIMQKTIYKWCGYRERNINELPKEITLGSAPSEEKFLRLTRKYISNLFKFVNPNNKANIIVDQLVPPTNLQRYVRYVDDIKVFVIDRDPRDIFILENEIWRGTVIPRDTKTFCQWFNLTRKHRKTEKFDLSNSLFIRFEDLINNYESSVDKIVAFAALDKNAWENKGKIFVPEKSANNTRLWLKYPKYDKDIEFIEDNLKEFLYKW